MNKIITSVIVMSILGFIFGIILTWASKKFAVKADPKLKDIIKVLPLENCGKCGFPSCGAFAKAVLEGKAPADGCAVGKDEVAEKIKEILK